MKKLSILGVTTLTILTLVACSNTNSTKENQSNIVSTTSSSRTAVSADEAKATALSEVGVSEEEVVNLVVRKDTEASQAVFDVQFVYEETEYEFTINATSGDIIERSQEASENLVVDSDVAEAKSVVFDDAGVTEDSITNLTVNNDVTDDWAQTQQVIEIEFDYNGKEFSYTIDASTMEIIEKESETID